jgi:hypothetical protein
LESLFEILRHRRGRPAQPTSTGGAAQTSAQVETSIIVFLYYILYFIVVIYNAKKQKLSDEDLSKVGELSWMWYALCRTAINISTKNISIKN